MEQRFDLSRHDAVEDVDHQALGVHVVGDDGQGNAVTGSHVFDDLPKRQFGVNRRVVHRPEVYTLIGHPGKAFRINTPMYCN